MATGSLTIAVKAYAWYKICPQFITQGGIVTTIQADTVPPSFTVSTPSPVNVPENGLGSARISGTASDNQSGVALVEWNVPEGLLLGAPWKAAAQQASGWASWQADVPVTLSPNTIIFRARDRAGNTSEIQMVTVQGIDNTAPTVTITEIAARPLE